MVKRVEDGGKVYTFPDDATIEEMDAAIKTSVATTEGRNLPGEFRGLASVAQGPTLGFADEMAGGLSAIGQWVNNKLLPTPRAAASLQTSPSEAYRNTRDLMRGAAAEESMNNPGTTMLTRGMAAAPLMAFNPAGAAAPTTMLGRSGVAAAQGGLFGTVQGAGESTADSALGIAKDAALTGATSAAMGGAFTPLAEMAGTGGKMIASKFNGSAADRYARQKVAEALLRDAPKGLTSPEAVIGSARARLANLGTEGRAVDAGGQNTRALLDTLATLPGQTKQATEQAIRSRQSTRAGRMVGALEDSLNPSGIRLSETVSDLIARRKDASKPLYKQLENLSIKRTDEIANIIERADNLGALAQARRGAIADGVPFKLDRQWDGRMKAPVSELDQVKQALDKMIADEVDAFGKTKPFGAKLLGLKHELTDAVDAATGGANGAYAQARQAFAGPSALIDAAESGRKALSLDDMAIKTAMKGITESEQEAFRVGAAEALRAKLTTRSGQTQVTELWREKGMQEKLKAIFGNERNYREFAVEVAKEARMKGMERIGGSRGSKTSEILYGAGDLDVSALADAAHAATSAAHGNVPGVMAWAGQQLNRVGTPEPVRNRMGQMLLGQGPVGQRGLLDAQTVMQEVQAAKLRNAGAYGLLGSFLSPF
jgi:hypothetical protein